MSSRHVGEWRYSFTNRNLGTRLRWVVSFTSPRDRTPVRIGQEVGWVPEPVWALIEKRTELQSFIPQPSHYTDWAMSALDQRVKWKERCSFDETKTRNWVHSLQHASCHTPKSSWFSGSNILPSTELLNTNYINSDLSQTLSLYYDVSPWCEDPIRTARLRHDSLHIMITGSERWTRNTVHHSVESFEQRKRVHLLL
jgi:hypothetical protein